MGGNQMIKNKHSNDINVYMELRMIENKVSESVEYAFSDLMKEYFNIEYIAPQPSGIEETFAEEFAFKLSSINLPAKVGMWTRIRRLVFLNPFFQNLFGK
jgi:hypothetical protein